MAHITADRLLEYTNVIGTGAVTPLGAVPAYATLGSKLTSGDTFHYLIQAISGGVLTGAYEFGLGTWGTGTFTRTAVYGSSNAGAAVNFAAGTKQVALVILAPTTSTQTAWRGALGLGTLATISYPGGTTNFLRADGTWAVPPGGGGGGGAAWGTITGTLSSQTDLASALAGKEPSIAAGTSGQYWRWDKTWAQIAYSQISGTPALATVATTGAYSSLTGLPTLGTLAALSYPGGTGTFLRADGTWVAAPATAWGAITGTIASQTDLINRIAAVNRPGNTQDYLRADGQWATPPLPVNADWTAGSGLAQVLNKPTLGTVAALSYPGGTTSFLRSDGTFAAPTAAAAWGSITGTLASQTDLNTALTARVLKAGDTMTGTLTIANTGPRFELNKAASGQSSIIVGSKAGSTRWVISLGAGDVEAGSNSGSNFYITRYSDAAAGLGDVMSINRANGLVGFGNSVLAGGTITANGGFVMAPFQTGLTSTSLANESGTNRMRLFSAAVAVGADVQGNVEHQPGVFLRHRTYVNGPTFDMDSGGTGYSAGGWVATSDQRVKYDNQVITGALDKVASLTGYTYLRQDMADVTGRVPRKAGLIAQQVLKVLPEAVVVPPNYDPIKDRGDLLALDSYGVIGLLVNAINELRAEVDTLKAKLEN